eukprot:384460_1
MSSMTGTAGVSRKNAGSWESFVKEFDLPKEAKGRLSSLLERNFHDSSEDLTATERQRQINILLRVAEVKNQHARKQSTDAKSFPRGPGLKYIPRDTTTMVTPRSAAKFKLSAKNDAGETSVLNIIKDTYWHSKTKWFTRFRMLEDTST